MTAVVYSTGAGFDGAGTAAGIFCGSSSVTADQGVYVWIGHNGSSPGLYKFDARDSGGTVLYTLSTLGSWTTPGGDTLALGHVKAPSTASDVRFFVTCRNAGDSADVNVTGFDRGYVLLTGQHGSSPHGSIVTATGTGTTVAGATTSPGVDALLLSFILRDTEYKSVSGEPGIERLEQWKTTVVTQTVTTSGAVSEGGLLSASDGWLVVTVPVLPAVVPSSVAPSFSNVSAALKSGKPNDVRVSFTSNISTVGLTVTASATTPNQPTAVTSTSVTWSGSDGYIDLDDLGPGEPWSFTVTGDNGRVATVGAGDITIRALSFTGRSYADSGYSETGLAWRDRNSGEVVTSVTVAAGATTDSPYLAVTLLTGDIMAKDGVTPTTSSSGTATVGATGTDGVATITGVAAGTATISATSGTGTATFTVNVTGTSSAVTPTWVTSSIPTFAVGVAGSYRLQATDATLFTASGLPSGATLSPDGLLSWTPGTTASASVTFTATSSSGGTANRTLTVASSTAAAPVITTTSPITAGSVATAYSKSFAATGTGPITWSATGVPAGLTFTSGGLLSGTPLFPGTSELVVSATNSAGTTTGTFVLAINAAASAAQVSSAWAPILRGRA